MVTWRFHSGQEYCRQQPETLGESKDSDCQYLCVELTGRTCELIPAPLAMDTDKIKIFGARVKVDGTGKLAELERAERVRRVCLIRASYIYSPKGKDEGKGGGDSRTRDQLLRQSTIDLQLSRIPS